MISRHSHNDFKEGYFKFIEGRLLDIFGKTSEFHQKSLPTTISKKAILNSSKEDCQIFSGKLQNSIRNLALKYPQVFSEKHQRNPCIILENTAQFSLEDLKVIQERFLAILRKISSFPHEDFSGIASKGSQIFLQKTQTFFPLKRFQIKHQEEFCYVLLKIL